MSDALVAEFAALNAHCAVSPRDEANYAATLRRAPRGKKEGMLFNSAIYNYAALVRLLLADGLSPNTVKSEHGNSSLLHVAAKHGSIDVLRLLLEAGADANSIDSIGSTPLVDAIRHGQLACARELIPHTDLRIFDVSGNNVLHASILSNQPEIFKLLLPHFADDIDVRTVKKRAPCDPEKPYNATPLHIACQSGYHAMAKALLAAGAMRTARDNNSCSCLHAAAHDGHLACVTLLIGRPDSLKMSAAEINAPDKNGLAAFVMAVMGGHRYCCAALLAAGADPAADIQDGFSALDLAKHLHPGNQELIELLECRGGGPAPLLCAGCGASDKRLHFCSACGSASFCSAACMAQAWTKGKHKAECKRIQAKKEMNRSRIIKRSDMPAPL